MDDWYLSLFYKEILNKDHENHDSLNEYVHLKRPRPTKMLSLIIFGAFIFAFFFYYQFHILISFFVFLIFILWYVKSDLNIFKKRYGSTEDQYTNCFIDAQNFILKGKYEKAKEALDQYRDKYNDIKAMVLYIFTLFTNKDYELVIKNQVYCQDLNNHAFQLIIGLSYYYLNQYDEALSIFENLDRLSLTNQLLLNYYGALTASKLNDAKKYERFKEKILGVETNSFSIENLKTKLLESLQLD